MALNIPIQNFKKIKKDQEKGRLFTFGLKHNVLNFFFLNKKRFKHFMWERVKHSFKGLKSSRGMYFDWYMSISYSSRQKYLSGKII